MADNTASQPDGDAGTYQYSPLPATDAKVFRLLHLLPGNDQDPIQCLLVDSELEEEKYNFEALSYVWGDPSSPNDIQVNGESFPVGKNLYHALLHLRKAQEGTRVLWIDAICINQADNEEKNIQVGMMGDIYRRALCTVVWLGSATEDTTKVLEEIKTLETDDLSSRAKTRDSYKDWDCIFANAWWERVWTLQEIMLADGAVLAMGSELVEWTVFSKFIEKARVAGYFPRGIGAAAAPGQTEVLEKLQAIRSLPPSIETPGDELLYYLASSSARKATVARDKLFGVLGLISMGPIKDETGTPLGPNYGSEEASVYIAATKAIVTTCANPDALGFCHPTSTSGLPSWAPDWGTISDDSAFASPLFQNPQGTRRTSHASPGATFNPRWEDQPDADTLLILHGHTIDIIAGVTEPQPRWSSKVVVQPDSKFGFTTLSTDEEVKAALLDFFAHARRYLTWEQFAKDNLFDIVPSPEDILTIFRETLTTGQGFDVDSFKLWRHCLRTMTYKLEVHGRYDLVPQGVLYKNDRQSLTMMPPGNKGVIREDADAVWLDTGKFAPYLGHTANRRLGVTTGEADNGSPGRFLCLLPKEAQLGDLLVILRGGRFPVVLRRDQNTENNMDTLFQFIGEAYVHGIMNGEAFDNDACQEFRIR